MTGLKSGSGDDLWGDEDETGDGDDDTGTDEPRSSQEGEEGSTEETTTETGSREHAGGDDTGTDARSSTERTQPYIVRRAVQDKSVQFERDERLTFFVHDDVTEGERDLVTEVESALGRDVPKFDVREAVYRAALQNPDDVLDELLEMGYSLDEE